MATCRSSHASFYDPSYYHRPNDRLACGNLRSDHDDLGNCDSCPICKLNLCPSDHDCKLHEGIAYHTNCLMADRRKAAVQAIKALLDASDRLNAFDEEALYLSCDPAPANNSDAYEAIDLLHRWYHRNAATFAVTK